MYVNNNPCTNSYTKVGIYVKKDIFEFAVDFPE